MTYVGHILTFVPDILEPYPKPQSIKAKKSNPGLAPVGVKSGVKQANAGCPTIRCPVTPFNSQAPCGPVTHLGRVVRKPDRLNL